MMSQTILIGNLGEDVTVRKTGSGVSVTTFSLATEEVWRDAQGAKQKRTTWHKVQAWKGHAETIAAYCGKGSLLQVTGTYIQEQPWVDKDGVKRQGMICRLDSMTLMPDPKRRNQQPKQQQQQNAAAPKPTQKQGHTYEEMKAVGWTDEQLKANGYANLVPKPNVPTPPPGKASVPTPPVDNTVDDQGFNMPEGMEPPVDYGV